LQFNTTPPSLLDNNSTLPIVQFSQSSSSATNANPTTSNASPKATTTTARNNAKTLQPKKSTSSPLSKIKFHSISKRQQKQLNMNEKFQLIRKHGTSSSSFIGSDEYDYINYGGGDNKSSCSGGKSSSLKKYFLKFAGDKVNNSNSLEARNLFHLKRHHYPSTGASSSAAKASTSDDNDFDILDF
jgi:hypothetical protein